MCDTFKIGTRFDFVDVDDIYEDRITCIVLKEFDRVEMQRAYFSKIEKEPPARRNILHFIDWLISEKLITDCSSESEWSLPFSHFMTRP